MVASLDGKSLIRDQATGSAADPESIGIELAGKLKQQGAGDILKEIFDEVRPEACSALNLQRCPHLNNLEQLTNVSVEHAHTSTAHGGSAADPVGPWRPMDSEFTAAIAMETEVTISDRARRTHQLAPLSALGGEIHRIDLFRHDGERSLRGRRLGITNGDRPGTQALTGTDHTDLPTPQIQHDPGVS